jgi:hypothetical protein
MFADTLRYRHLDDVASVAQGFSPAAKIYGDKNHLRNAWW